MKMIMTLCAIVLLGLSGGCGCREEPVAVGKLKTGLFWKYSLACSSTSNEGDGYDAGSRVEIYREFVVIRTPDGISHFHPHGFYSHLSIERE